MKKRIKLLLSIIIAGFIIFGAWKVNQVLAGCPGCTYCTGPCGVPVCGDGACTSDAVQCDTYEWVCESGEYDEHDDCIGGLEYIERCDYYEVSCPAESGCCTTICDTGETDPSTPPEGEEEEGGGGGGGEEGEEEGGGTEVGDPITGTVRQDDSWDAALVGGLCTLGGASGVEPGAGTQVDVATVGFDVAANGAYNTGNITAGTYPVSLDIGDPSTWLCTCPTNCAYGAIATGTSNVDFFVTQTREAWFQVQDGSLHADSGSVVSDIPSTCTGACDPYLITGEEGLVSYTGSLSLGDMDSTGISETSNDWQADTDFKGNETDYAYFYRVLSEDPDGFAVWDGSEPGSSGVYEIDGSVSTSGSWSIAGGQASVMLVDGNLVIDQNISVATDSFLAFIASGSITIDDDVTNVEGVMIADNLINTCDSASGLQLNAEGIYVGWGGVNMCRDYGDIRNNTSPIEVFVYRPDLQVNAYNYLMRPNYFWQEVAP